MTTREQYIPEGFHTLTPYLTCRGVPRLLEFLRQAFGAQETFRMARQDGSIAHASARIGDSMVEMAEPAGEWKAMPANLHLYVQDADHVYRRALTAGGTALYELQDMSYGDREGGVEDPSGNYWYIATHKTGKNFVPNGFRAVTPGLSLHRAADFLVFAEKALGANVVQKQETPSGTISHSTIRIGDCVLEASEAHGRWGPRPIALHIYVPHVDAVYASALRAGAKSLHEPKDQVYGERSGSVVDAWGNHWYIASHRETLSKEEIERRAGRQTAAKG